MLEGSVAKLVNPFDTLRTINKKNQYYSLPALEEQGLGKVRRLPVSIRIMLESLLRNCDGHVIKEEDVKRLAQWNPTRPDQGDVPFVVSRVILQDFTGVPLVVDLAAMRDAVASRGDDTNSSILKSRSTLSSTIPYKSTAPGPRMRFYII